MLQAGFGVGFRRLRQSSFALLSVAGSSFAPNAVAAEYFVSPQGDDAADGSQAAPFRTIQRAADVLLPGDVCTVQHGVYRETVIPRNSGEAGRPIVFRSAQGAPRPLISGTDPLVGAFRQTSSGVYELDVPENMEQLFAQGRLLHEARWPNATVGTPLVDLPWATAKAGTTSTVQATGLPAGDYVGSLLHIVPGAAWVAYTRHVTAYDAVTQTLTLDRPIAELDALLPETGDAFYLFGARALLDVDGEWFYDTAARVLSLRSDVEPATLGLERKARSAAFVLDGRSYVEVRGFDVLAAHISVKGSEHSVVEDCHLAYPTALRTLNGYNTTNPSPHMTGSANEWRGNSVKHALASGLVVGGDSQLVSNSYFDDVAASGGNYAGIETTGSATAPVRALRIERNTITNSGRFALSFYNVAASSITSNRADRVCLVTLDCGHFYTWNTDGQGTVISHNHLSRNHTHLGFGVYLDDSSRNFVVHHNLVRDVAAAGIHIKAANDVINNTILPGKHGGMVGDAIVVSESLNARGPVDLSQSKIMNNLMSPVGALKLRLGQPTITDYAYFEVSVPGSAQWTPARTAFAEFEQPGWGKRASFTPDALTALHFGVSVQGNFVIQVDNLRLLPDASLIDDLEDGNATAPSGGRWSANAGAGSSIVFSVEGPGASSSYAATARGSHVPGGWLQLVHALSSTGGAVDLSSHSGLSFDYRVTFDPTFGTPPTLATARANADCPLDEHFVPTTSCAVDSGEAVPGITDGYFGAAPDIGAFERGAEHWTAGSTLAPRDDGSTGDVPSGDAEQPGTVKELPAACGCRVGQRSTQGSWVFALAALLAGLALRRRAQRTLGHEGRVFPPHL